MIPLEEKQMTKPIVFRTDAELEMGGSLLSTLEKIAQLQTASDDREATLIEQVTDADIIFTCYAPISARVIGAAKNLKGIVKYGVGVDSIDLGAATAHGVPVIHCPDYGTDTVADHAFSLMLSVARRITRIDRDIQRQGWLWPEPKYSGIELAGKTLGVIGFGRIGTAMARRAAGFGMRRLVCDPYVTPPRVPWDNLEFASREQVIEQADFLSLHCILTPETRGIIGAEQLRRMKNSAVLVNVSRGALIDEPALAEALRSGTIAGAGLDVFMQEPLEKEHPLFGIENVLLSPHLAFYTDDAYHRLEGECVAAIGELLAGRIPKNLRNTDLVGKTNASLTDQTATDDSLRTEGDINLSQTRTDWQDSHIDEETRQLLDRDEKVFIHQSLSTPCLNTLSASRGIYLVDTSGREIMDFHGNSAHQVGFGHPHIVEAITAELGRLPFCPRRYTNEPAIRLAEKLASLAPGNLNKVLFAPGGAAAIGMALKLARYATGRHKTISMWDSFHGASLDAISIGGEALFRDGLGPLLPGSFHVPWPRQTKDADAIEKFFIEHHDIGAVIAEPMRCTTIDAPPQAYWRRVRELCDEYGALLVFDEIPTALGRTGNFFCCEHFDVFPDILVIGKGLGGGVMPMAAMLAREDLDIASDRALGHYTHEKSPLGAAAALATIEIIESENLLEQSRQLGEHAVARLTALKQQFPIIADVRGLGLSLAVELRHNNAKAVHEAERVMYECLARGLSFKVSDGNVLTLTPPLIISRQQLDDAIDIVAASITSVTADLTQPA